MMFTHSFLTISHLSRGSNDPYNDDRRGRGPPLRGVRGLGRGGRRWANERHSGNNQGKILILVALCFKAID